MNGLLVRVGVDSSCGNWLAPVNPSTGEFVYVPIPESRDSHPDLQRTYDEFVEPLRHTGVELPTDLDGEVCHLDPDFEHLTFGDQGQRGRQISRLTEGDILAFFASLRPIDGLD